MVNDPYFIAQRDALLSSGQLTPQQREQLDPQEGDQKDTRRKIIGGVALGTAIVAGYVAPALRGLGAEALEKTLAKEGLEKAVQEQMTHGSDADAIKKAIESDPAKMGNITEAAKTEAQKQLNLARYKQLGMLGGGTLGALGGVGYDIHKGDHDPQELLHTGLWAVSGPAAVLGFQKAADYAANGLPFLRNRANAVFENWNEHELMKYTQRVLGEKEMTAGQYVSYWEGKGVSRAKLGKLGQLTQGNPLEIDGRKVDWNTKLLDEHGNLCDPNYAKLIDKTPRELAGIALTSFKDSPKEYELMTRVLQEAKLKFPKPNMTKAEVVAYIADQTKTTTDDVLKKYPAWNKIGDKEVVVQDYKLVDRLNRVLPKRDMNRDEFLQFLRNTGRDTAKAEQWLSKNAVKAGDPVIVDGDIAPKLKRPFVDQAVKLSWKANPIYSCNPAISMANFQDGAMPAARKLGLEVQNGLVQIRNVHQQLTAGELANWLETTGKIKNPWETIPELGKLKSAPGTVVLDYTGSSGFRNTAVFNQLERLKLTDAQRAITFSGLHVTREPFAAAIPSIPSSPSWALNLSTTPLKLGLGTVRRVVNAADGAVGRMDDLLNNTENGIGSLARTNFGAAPVDVVNGSPESIERALRAKIIAHDLLSGSMWPFTEKAVLQRIAKDFGNNGDLTKGQLINAAKGGGLTNNDLQWLQTNVIGDNNTLIMKGGEVNPDLKVRDANGQVVGPNDPTFSINHFTNAENADMLARILGSTAKDNDLLDKLAKRYGKATPDSKPNLTVGDLRNLAASGQNPLSGLDPNSLPGLSSLPPETPLVKDGKVVFKGKLGLSEVQSKAIEGQLADQDPPKVLTRAWRGVNYLWQVHSNVFSGARGIASGALNTTDIASASASDLTKAVHARAVPPKLVGFTGGVYAPAAAAALAFPGSEFNQQKSRSEALGDVFIPDSGKALANGNYLGAAGSAFSEVMVLDFGAGTYGSAKLAASNVPLFREFGAGLVGQRLTLGSNLSLVGPALGAAAKGTVKAGSYADAKLDKSSHYRAVKQKIGDKVNGWLQGKPNYTLPPWAQTIENGGTVQPTQPNDTPPVNNRQPEQPQNPPEQPQQPAQPTPGPDNKPAWQKALDAAGDAQQ